MSLIIVATVFGAVSSYLLTDPRAHASNAEEVILAEYLKVYCGHKGKNFVGEAAALSRLTIAAHLDKLALAEYAKCRIGLSK